MKKLLIICFLFVSLLSVKAQYELQFNQLIKAVEFINPGYNAIHSNITGNIIYSNQWNGFPGSPATAGASFHVPFKGRHLGFGAIFTNETLGLRELRTAGLSIDADVRLASKLFMTAGIMAGYQLVDYNLEDATTSYIEGLSDIYNYNAPVVGSGLNFIYDHLHVGVSGYFYLASLEYESETLNKLTFYSNASYWFRLDDTWRLKLAALYKSKGNYASIAEAGTYLLFRDIFWFGTSYRYRNAAIFSADIRLTSFLRVAYSYAFGMGPLANFSGDSHELQLLFTLPQSDSNERLTTR